jgi:RNA polymerase sigma factor (sigma-70 family)
VISNGGERAVTNGAQQVFQRQFRTILTTGALTGLTDDQLLERFAAGREGEADLAFEVLVERHGPMVMRICQSALRDSHDAEDAFQATFLVLVHRSRMIRKWQSLGPWLHGVALRVAACARRTTARRRAHERRWAEQQPQVELTATADHLDLGPVIHEEIERLPERFRAPSCFATWKYAPSTIRRGNSAGHWGPSRAGSIAAGDCSVTDCSAVAWRRGSPPRRSPA